MAGCAHAQEVSKDYLHSAADKKELFSSATVDSLTRAFFLLKYDYRVLEATSLAKSRMDSLRYSDAQIAFQERFEYERAKRRRDLVLLLSGMIVSGLVFYAGGAIAH